MKVKILLYLLLFGSLLFSFPQKELRQPQTILHDIQSKPNNAVLYNELGISYLASGSAEKAEKAFNKALTLNTTYADAYYGLGQIAYKNKNYKKAEEYLQIAAALHPTSTAYLGLLGRTYMQLHQWQKAISTLKKAIAIKGEKAGYFYSLLARCYDHTKNYKKSAECILQQIPSRPWDDTIYAAAAKKYYKAGEKKLGDKYKRLAGHAWNEYTALYKQYAANKAWAAYRDKDYDSAVVSFQKEIQRHPKTADNYWGLALSYIKLNDFKNAESALLQAVKFDPSMAKAYNKLGNIYLELSDFKKSLYYYKKALHTNSDDAYTLYSLSQFYIKQKNFTEAEKYLNRLTNKNPDKASYWSALGYVAEKNTKFKLSFNAYYSAYINSRTETERKRYIKKTIDTGLRYAAVNKKAKRAIAAKLLKITPKSNENYLILKNMAQ